MPTPNRTGQAAVTNLAPPGVEADLAPAHTDTFRRALIKADFVDCMAALRGLS